MESRAWGATKERTNLYVLKMHRSDLVLILITAGILATAIYVRLYVMIPSFNELLRGLF
jgi:energy-coupling factor transporter transmembrane protein EcfT